MIKVFVLGGVVGESVVIQAPDGSFGVIDSYAYTHNDPSSNPTIELLRRLGASELRFVALTHPHLDHYLGLSTLLKEFDGKVQEFWAPPFSQRDWEPLLMRLTEEFATDDTPEGKKSKGVGLSCFLDILERVQSKYAASKLEVKTTLDETVLLRDEDNDFRIHSLGPVSNVWRPYIEKLVGRVNLGGGQLEHNDVSSVIAVRYGGWVGLFGGDTEESSWAHVLRRSEAEWVAGARLIKVSHHCAENGSFSKLWGAVRSGRCVVITTCYEAQKLPSPRGMSLIHRKGLKLASTNKEIATHLLRTGERRPARSPDGTLRRLPANRRRDSGTVGVRVDKAGRQTITYEGAAGLIPPYGSGAGARRPR